MYYNIEDVSHSDLFSFGYQIASGMVTCTTNTNFMHTSSFSFNISGVSL